MSGIVTIVMGVVMFCFVVLTLVGVLLAAKWKLVPSGEVKILINDDETKTLATPSGNTLLNTLAANRIFVPSACGGKGSCGVCKVTVREGGGALLPTEEAHINRRQAREDLRLSCRAVKNDMRIEIPRKSSASASGNAGYDPTTTSPPSSRNWSWNCPRAKRCRSGRAAISRRNARPTR